MVLINVLLAQHHHPLVNRSTQHFYYVYKAYQVLGNSRGFVTPNVLRVRVWFIYLNPHILCPWSGVRDIIFVS